MSDDVDLAHWRGPLFEDFRSPIWWGKSYEMLKPPGSVTFPICDCCRRVVWEWPHFEEPVPEGAVCEECANDA